ncbi:MAG: PAS domain S-box protein [Verrucomicrobiota bacterium]|nr:PAS domain S-box protein [Verrucomicrobiota bacterium]
MQRTERLVLEQLARGVPLAGVLELLVREIEARMQDAIGSILLLDSEGRRLSPGAAPHLPDEYCRLIHGSEIGPQVGSCGTAAFTRRTVVVEDIATDPLWADCKQHALSHGLRACWSMPIIGENNRVLGTFAFYYRAPRRPTADELALVRSASNIARLAIYFGQAQTHLQLLSNAVARLNDIVLITEAEPVDDPGPRIVFVNEAFERITGYRREEAVGHSARILLHGPETCRETVQLIRAAHREKRPIRVELLKYKKSGVQYWAEMEIVPIFDHGGNVTHFVSIERDITERKLAYEALHEQQRRMKTLLSNLPGMAYRCRNDARWTMEFVSDGCHALTGYEPEALLGNRQISYEELIEPEDRAAVRNSIEAALAHNQSFELTYRIRARNGGVRWVWGRGQGVLSPDDAVQFLEGFVSDITDNKRLEAQALQAQRLESIGTLAGGIAHDLNNVLAPILISVDLLRDKITDERLGSLIGMIANNAQRGAELVRQILLFARGAEGRRIVVMPTGILEELRRLLDETFPKSISIEISAPPELPKISCDPTQIHQVLLNLCVNARDAMPSGGLLRLTASTAVFHTADPKLPREGRPGAYVQIDVTDTGCGIPETIRDRIFDPFFTTKEIGRGTGLGLSTTRSIIKTHSGFLTFVSAAGTGTTFSIFLPAEPIHGQTPSVLNNAGATELPRGSGECILVVDDELFVRQIVRSALEFHGYRVLLAADGAEAVQMFTRHSDIIELAVVDMQMPGVDGAATIVALHNLRPTLHVVCASGFSNRQSRAQVECYGVRHFLDKPFNSEALVRTVQAALRDSYTLADHI